MASFTSTVAAIVYAVVEPEDRSFGQQVTLYETREDAVAYREFVGTAYVKEVELRRRGIEGN